MNNFKEIEYNVTGGTTPLNIINGKNTNEKVAVQVVTDATYDGTTDKITIQESNDGVKWNNIEWDGTTLELTINAPNDTFMLKTYIFFGLYLRAFFTKGDSTQGTLTISTKTKE